MRRLPEARKLNVRFDQVSGLELGDFNEQNVLFDLHVAGTADGFWEIRLQPSYGLGANFRASRITSSWVDG